MPPIAYFHDFVRHHRSLDAARDPDPLGLRPNGTNGRRRTGRTLTASISAAWKRLAAEGGAPAQTAEVDRIRNVWDGGPAAPAAVSGAPGAASATGSDANNGQGGDEQEPGEDEDGGDIDSGGDQGAEQGDDLTMTGTKRPPTVDMGVQTESTAAPTATATPAAAPPAIHTIAVADIPYEVVASAPPRKK
jgi:hypothetical protein